MWEFMRLDQLSDYMPSWRRYEAESTPAQRRRYNQLLAGRVREDGQPYRKLPDAVRRDAVDVVMREPAAGVCCEPCAERKL